MDDFFAALTSGERSPLLPEEYDWYAPLLGDWDTVYTDGFDQPEPRRVQGEWLFRRGLDGMAILDLFLCPSRASRVTDPQPDGEYGLSVRMFHPETGSYHMTYVCAQRTTQLEVKKEGEQIVCTVRENPRAKWVFSQVTGDSFLWRNITVLDSGEWWVNAQVQGRRKTERRP